MSGHFIIYLKKWIDIIAMQVDLDIPEVIGILKELDVYRGQIDEWK